VSDPISLKVCLARYRVARIVGEVILDVVADGLIVLVGLRRQYLDVDPARLRRVVGTWESKGPAKNYICREVSHCFYLIISY
jgi:hypothetical protein